MRLETNAQIVEAVKTVRKYADKFGTADGYDLRTLSKDSSGLHWTRLRKLQRMYDEIDFGKSKLHTIVKIRKPPKNATRSQKIKYTKRKRALQEAALQEHYPKNLNVAFIPVVNPKKGVKLEWVGNKLKSIKQKGEPNSFVIDWLDPENLVTNLKQEIKETLAQAPSAKSFHIQAGRHTIWNDLLTAEQLPKRIQFLMRRYPEVKVDIRGNEYHNPNSYTDWLGGVIGFEIAGRKAATFQGKYEKKKRKVNTKRAGLKKIIKALSARKTQLTQKEKRSLTKAQADLQKLL